MTRPVEDPASELRGTVQSSWHRFLDVCEPLRSDLHRDCRPLAGTPSDAEDLAQDAMARAFVALGCMGQEIRNPRAWLFRVASNLWIDRARRAREAEEHAETSDVPSDADVSDEAARVLFARLSPQERAAVVLRDVFDFTLDVTAHTLSTTSNAVKAALHRARGKLASVGASAGSSPEPAVVDAFCAAFNARDMSALTALLLENGSVEIVGVHTEYGPEAAGTGTFVGMLYGSSRMSGEDPRGGMDPIHRHGVTSRPARVEARVHRGELVVLHWYEHQDGERVRAVSRLETDGGRIARVRNYFYTPDFIAHVCGDMGLPFRVNGYRSW